MYCTYLVIEAPLCTFRHFCEANSSQLSLHDEWKSVMETIFNVSGWDRLIFNGSRQWCKYFAWCNVTETMHLLIHFPNIKPVCSMRSDCPDKLKGCWLGGASRSFHAYDISAHRQTSAPYTHVCSWELRSGDGCIFSLSAFPSSPLSFWESESWSCGCSLTAIKQLWN